MAAAYAALRSAAAADEPLCDRHLAEDDFAHPDPWPRQSRNQLEPCYRDIPSCLIPVLVKRRHEVVGSTRSTGNLAKIRALGAHPVVMNGLEHEGGSGCDRRSKARRDRASDDGNRRRLSRPQTPGPRVCAHRPPHSPLRQAARESTTSWMTTRQRSPCGCRSSPASWVLSHRCVSRSGWDDSPSARRGSP
jgi:hypothetical protein